MNLFSIHVFFTYFYREMGEPLTAKEELEANEIQNEVEQLRVKWEKLRREFEEHKAR